MVARCLIVDRCRGIYLIDSTIVRARRSKTGSSSAGNTGRGVRLRSPAPGLSRLVAVVAVAMAVGSRGRRSVVVVVVVVLSGRVRRFLELVYGLCACYLHAPLI